MKEISARATTFERPDTARLIDPSPLSSPAPFLVEEQRSPLVVVKFGGYAMSTPENVARSAAIMHADPERRRIAVVAAPGDKEGDLSDDSNKGVTSLLREAYRLRSRELSFDRPFYAVRNRFREYGKDLEESSFVDELMSDLYRDIDNQESAARVISYGEKGAMLIFAKILGGSPVDPVNYILAKNGTYSFLGGLPQNETGFDVVAGHYGTDEYGNIELFPSPGGNYTASIIAAGVNAEGLEIYKKDPGYLSADPKIVANPHRIEEMTYTEMMMINDASKKPIVPTESVMAAIEDNIRIKVNSLDDPQKGTMIAAKRSSGQAVVGVVGKGGSTSFTVTGRGRSMHHNDGIIAQVSQAFADDHRSINHIFSEINKVTVSLDEDQLTEGGRKVDLEAIERKLQAIEGLAGRINVGVKENLATVSVVGEGVGKDSINVIGTVASALQGSGIDVEEFTHAGGKNVIFTVDKAELRGAINAVHDAFFPEDAIAKGK